MYYHLLGSSRDAGVERQVFQLGAQLFLDATVSIGSYLCSLTDRHCSVSLTGTEYTFS